MKKLLSPRIIYTEVTIFLLVAVPYIIRTLETFKPVSDKILI